MRVYRTIHKYAAFNFLFLFLYNRINLFCILKFTFDHLACSSQYNVRGTDVSLLVRSLTARVCFSKSPSPWPQLSMVLQILAIPSV